MQTTSKICTLINHSLCRTTSASEQLEAVVRNQRMDQNNRDLGKRFPIQRAGAASQLYGLSQAVCTGFCRCTGTCILGVSYLKLPGVCLCCFSCCCCNGCIAVEKKKGAEMGKKRRKKREEGRERRKDGKREGGRNEGMEGRRRMEG